jgi:hypothetical protein
VDRSLIRELLAPRWLTFMVAGERRSVSRRLWDLMQGPKPPVDFGCDGCSWSPDWWRGYKLWPACVLHDYHYRTGVLGGSAEGRASADAYFRMNVKALLLKQGMGAWRAAAVSRLYWGRVRVWGAGSYRHWERGEEPRSRWARLREAWTPWRT